MVPPPLQTHCWQFSPQDTEPLVLRAVLVTRMEEVVQNHTHFPEDHTYSQHRRGYKTTLSVFGQGIMGEIQVWSPPHTYTALHPSLFPPSPPFPNPPIHPFIRHTFSIHSSSIHSFILPSIRPLVIECLFPVHHPRPLKLAAWNVIIGPQ